MVTGRAPDPAPALTPALMPGSTTGFGSTSAWTLASALGQLRERSPEYRRWWSHRPGPDPDPATPWSDRDEEKVARLAAVDPWWLRSVAGELDRVRTEVHEVGVALARLAEAAIGGPAAAACGRLALSSHQRATEAGELSRGLRDAGREIDEVVGSAAHRMPGPAHLPDEPADGRPGRPASDGGFERDDGFERYAAVLRAVRAQLTAILDRLPTLVLGEPDDPWARPPATRWVPEPGGPPLPTTAARRVEPGYGVRIARLPDGPPG